MVVSAAVGIVVSAAVKSAVVETLTSVVIVAIIAAPLGWPSSAFVTNSFSTPLCSIGPGVAPTRFPGLVSIVFETVCHLSLFLLYLKQYVTSHWDLGILSERRQRTEPRGLMGPE